MASPGVARCVLLFFAQMTILYLNISFAEVVTVYDSEENATFQWHSPILSLEPSQLVDLLNTQTNLTFDTKNTLGANDTFGRIFPQYLLRLSCVSNNGLHHYKSLQHTLLQLSRNSRLKNGLHSPLNFYLSFVPGLHNSSSYEGNLERITDLTVTVPGLISLVLIDFTSILIGPFDLESVSRILHKCDNYGLSGNFNCGIILDRRLCPDQQSIFYHLRYPKTLEIFFNLNTNFPDGIDAVLDTCGNSLHANGFRIQGLLFNDTVTVTQHNFGFNGFDRAEYRKVQLERVNNVVFRNHTPQNACHHETLVKYSDNSLKKSSSVLLHVEPETLLEILNRQSLTSNMTADLNGTEFLQMFTRFLVEFNSVTETKNNSPSSITGLLNAVVKYSQKFRTSNSTRPISIWIMFIPTANLETELMTIVDNVRFVNALIPETVTKVVLDYKFLRVNQNAFPVIKRDVEVCNSIAKKSQFYCAFVFHKRNCINTNKPIENLPFENNTTIFIRPFAFKCAHTQRNRLNIGGIELPIKPLPVEVDFTSNTFSYLEPAIELGETVPFPVAFSIFGSHECNEGTVSISERWLYKPTVFSPKNFGFVVTFADMEEKFIGKHPTIISDDISFQVITTNCPLKESASVIVLKLVSDDAMLNLEFTRKTLSSIQETNKLCPGLITRVLIEWLNCKYPICDSSDHLEFYPMRFKTLTPVLDYLSKQNLIEMGLDVTLDADMLRLYMMIKDPDSYNDLANVVTPYSVHDAGKALNRSELMRVFRLVDKVVFSFEVDFNSIVTAGSYKSAYAIINKMELMQTRVEFYFGSYVRTYPGVAFVLKVYGCTNDDNWKDVAEYVQYWEILNNWADSLDVTLFMNSAVENTGLKECKEESEEKCPCGWWSRVENKGQLIDQKTRALRKYEVQNNKKHGNTQIAIGWYNSTLLILAIIVPISIFVSVIAITSAYVVQRRQKGFTLNRKNIKWLMETNQITDSNLPVVAKRPHEIQKDHLKIDDKFIVGQGASGTKIYRGTFKDAKSIQDVDVAMKVFKSRKGSTVSDEELGTIRGVISEIQILSYLGDHHHLVKFYGACTSSFTKGELTLVLEYCCFGSLERYLQQERLIEVPQTVEYDNSSGLANITLHDMEKWSGEIASGLAFLASKQVVHADVAARNILVDANKSMKISDFGLSQRMENYKVYKTSGEQALPWRWMAPESLRKLVFNEKTDVWMFGVTVWEIYTLAEVPFGGLAWNNSFPTMLDNGIRLECPRIMPMYVKELLASCWQIDGKNRPSFSSCHKTLIEGSM